MPTKEELMKGTVAVLLGGKSAERDVSLRTGEAFAEALSARGYAVEKIDPVEDISAVLSSLKPVAAIVALHGRWGEDGCLQGLLEILGVPYSGSGVTASAIAMDKSLTKRLIAVEKIPTPSYRVIESGSEVDYEDVADSLGYPLVVKPAREGSSVGISMVTDRAALGSAIEGAARPGGSVLLERYVRGRELSVAVLDGRVLGVIEIVPARPFYDYEAKYGSESGTRYLYPAPIPDELTSRVEAMASKVFSVLGCSGVCRVDFMVDEESEPWFIEINTLPGMTKTSLVPKIAEGVGISFEELCERLLLGARLQA